MARAPTILATIGLVLSLYALHVEHTQAALEAARDAYESSGRGDGTGEEEIIFEEYRSLCDIESLGASCSATFALPEGRMLSYFGLVPAESPLDVPNALLGALYYAYVLLYSLNVTASVFPPALTFAASCMAMSSSLFLAYKLLVLKKLCLLCWTTHVLNFLLIVHYGRALLGTAGGSRGEKAKKKMA
jgi:hypothetical protein